MYATLDRELLTTHEAARLLGYTHDYIARMCREHRLKAERQGTQWMVDREAMEKFQAEHEARLKQSRAAVAALRRVERTPAALAVTRAVPGVRNVHTRVISRVLHETVAVSVALVVTCGSVALAASGVLTVTGEALRATALMTADGAGMIVEDAYHSLALSAQPPVAPPLTSLVPYTAPQGVALPKVPAVPASAALSPIEIATYAPTDWRVTFTPGLEAVPHIPAAVGSAGLALGTGLRDVATAVPDAFFTSALALGESFGTASEYVLSSYIAGVYAFTALPEPVARGTIDGLLTIGSYTEAVAVSAPSLVASLYLEGTQALAFAGPVVAEAIVGAEEELGHFLAYESEAISRTVIATVTDPRPIRALVDGIRATKVSIAHATESLRMLSGDLTSVTASAYSALAPL